MMWIRVALLLMVTIFAHWTPDICTGLSQLYLKNLFFSQELFAATLCEYSYSVTAVCSRTLPVLYPVLCAYSVWCRYSRLAGDADEKVVKQSKRSSSAQSKKQPNNGKSFPLHDEETGPLLSETEVCTIEWRSGCFDVLLYTVYVPVVHGSGIGNVLTLLWYVRGYV